MLEKFKDLGAFFKNKEVLIENMQKDMQNKVNDYLDKNMLNLIVEYRIAGYVLTNTQLKSFNKKYDEVNSSNKINFLANMLEKGKKISDDIMIEFYNSYVDLQISNHGYIKYTRCADSEKVEEEYSKRCKDKEFLSKLTNYIVKRIDEEIFNHRLKFIKRPYENVTQAEVKYLSHQIELYLDLALEYMTEEHTKNLLETMNKLSKICDYKHYYNSSYKLVEQKYIQCKEKDISNDIENMQYLYNNLDKNIEKIHLEEKNDKKIKSLPSNIKMIVDKITNNYIVLKSNIDNLSTEENFKMKNLMEKRVPEVLNLYLNFDEKYRNSMKTDKGLTIEDLTIDSLKDIEKAMEEISLHSNERKLNNAAALNRYTKNL